MGFTDAEIIKGINYCANVEYRKNCDNCPIKAVCDSEDYGAIKLVNDIINRQKAEIERLKESRDRWKRNAQGFDEASRETERMIERLMMLVDESESNSRNALKIINSYENDLKTAKAEAIKEFAKRLKEQYEIWNDDEYYFNYVTTDQIDNLVKEMTNKESSKIINSDSRQTEINNKAHSSVRSFAEKLKYQLSLGLENKIPANVYSFVYCTVDNLVKEMVGDAE